MNRKKLVYLALSEEIPSKNAANVHITEIIKNLKDDADVELFAKKGYKKYDYVNYVDLPNGFKENLNIKNIFKIKELKSIIKKIKDFNPDVIYERWSHPNLISYLIKKIVKKPRILEVNSIFSEEIHDIPILLQISKFFRNIQFNNTEAIITQTKTLKRILEDITDTRVYVVQNGVNTSKFKENLKKPLDLEKDKIIITFVGSFKRWHGVNQITYIASKLKDYKDKISINLIGDGDLFNDINNELKINNLNNVHLLGSKDYKEIPNYLLNSDILIAPFDANNYKAFKKFNFWWCPIKLFEYMASGKPIVSYNYYEVREIVKNHNLLAKKGDMDDFVDKLKRLINNKKLREKIGKKNKEIAKNYDWKKRSEETRKIIEEVIAKK
jgi:glycosyltransferase involved in cell wall biosynthesis